MSFEKTGYESEGVKRLKVRIARAMTEHGRSRALSFKPRLDDVFVVTPTKCGTTWMQQIVHQLRSGGDMSFEEIGDVVPYIELAYDIEIDLEAEHSHQPRCYKTHLWYPHCPKGAKYIVIYREPCAAFYSRFNYLNGWLFQPEEISLHEFVKDFMLAHGTPKTMMENASYFDHFLSWWKHRNDSNVLFLFYEDMKDDLESVVKMVASFIGIQDEERIKKTVLMSSFEFMKENERQFSDIRYARYRNKVFGIPDDAVPSKVATGCVKRGRELMDDKTKEIIQARWLEVVGKETGFQDYYRMRNAFKNENLKY